METSASQEIIKALDTNPVVDRRKFRQIMRRELKKTGLDFEVANKVYYCGGWAISYSEVDQQIHIEGTDHVAVPKDKRESVSKEPGVGGKRKPRKKKSTKDGYPLYPDALALKAALEEFLEDPDNGVTWYRRLDPSISKKLHFSVDLWAMSRVTLDPVIFLSLLNQKMERLGVQFEDPDDVQWLMMKPALFWVGPILQKRA